MRPDRPSRRSITTSRAPRSAKSSGSASTRSSAARRRSSSRRTRPERRASKKNLETAAKAAPSLPPRPTPRSSPRSWPTTEARSRRTREAQSKRHPGLNAVLGNNDEGALGAIGAFSRWPARPSPCLTEAGGNDEVLADVKSRSHLRLGGAPVSRKRSRPQTSTSSPPWPRTPRPTASRSRCPRRSSRPTADPVLARSCRALCGQAQVRRRRVRFRCQRTILHRHRNRL